MLSYKKYYKDNDSDWIVFVHGAGGSSAIWYRQIKFFNEKYNILLLDLRGHGNSNKMEVNEKRLRYTFNFMANDIIEVLDYEQITSAHFAGISLGTIIIRQIAELYPQRVKSMIMGGAIVQFNVRSRILMKLGFIFKSIVPYLLLYKFFAFIIMPKANHKESRNMFVREVKKVYKSEFIRWFNLTINIDSLLKFFRNSELPIPVLYIMGEEDYMFLPAIKKITKQHENYSKLIVIPNCGHVVNVDNPTIFNNETLSFLSEIEG